jgi:predicted amino acid-binding ACT domain protein
MLSTTSKDRVVIASLTGPDGIGILEKASKVIFANGGVVADSRSATLQGVGVMMFEVKTDMSKDDLGLKLKTVRPRSACSNEPLHTTCVIAPVSMRDNQVIDRRIFHPRRGCLSSTCRRLTRP